MKPFYESILPPEIPDHELIRRIGEGSYGEIWLARTVMGIYRAVKIIYRARFEKDRSYEREFQGIQRFEPISRSHPGLVDILQIGRNDAAGYYYYVMELADDQDTSRPFNPDTYAAKTLNRHLMQHLRLPAAEALDIGRNLAAALGHMHQHQLVHRDIKPANIIFVNAEPKLADIGLVAPVTDGSSYVGTEGYIPPEGPGAVQADIYGLGMVLYEMSTGLDRLAFPELPAGLDQFPDGDLVVELNEVVVKACAKKPEARHQSAGELRSELDLLLGGRSVRRLRVVERQLTTVRRAAYFATFLVAAALVYIVVAGYLKAREDALLAEAYIKEGASRVAEGNLHAAMPPLAEALRLQRRQPDAADTMRVRLGTLWQQSPRLLQFWETGGNVSDVRFSPDGRRLLGGGGRRAWLMDIESRATVAEYPVSNMVETAVFSLDGLNIAIAHGKMVTVLDVATSLARFEFTASKHVNSAEFSPDGARIVVACEDRCAYVLNARDGEVIRELCKHTAGLWYANFSPDGTFIVTAGQDGTARLWDAETGEPRSPPLPHAPSIYSAAISPDGRQVVTAGGNGTLRIWHTNGTLAVSAGLTHRSGVRRASYSPDGRFIISAGFDQALRLWDAHTGRPAGAVLNLQAVGMQAVFDAEASRVVSAGAGGTIRIWQMRPDAPKNLGPKAAISGNGERYITVASNTLSFWNARDDSRLFAPQSTTGEVLQVLCNDAGTRAFALIRDAERGSVLARVFEAGEPGPKSFPIDDSERWWLNADGSRLLAGYKRRVHCWDTATAKMIFTTNASMTVHHAVFARSGGVLALGGENHRTVLLLDSATGRELGRSEVEKPGRIHALAFSPDSTKLVTAAGTGILEPCVAQLWDGRNGAALGLRLPHAASLMYVQFSHDGRRIATSSRDQHATVWDAVGGTPVFDSILLGTFIRSVAFSPDDRWIVTATEDEAQVWDAATGQPVSPPFGDPAFIERARFCAGGERIWVESRRGVLLWNLPRHPGKPDEWLGFAQHLGVTIPSRLRRSGDGFTTEQLLERCQQERERTGAGLDVWQRDQAELAEAGEDWFAAQFHLEKLWQKSTNDAALRARLDQAREQLRGTLP